MNAYIIEYTEKDVTCMETAFITDVVDNGIIIKQIFFWFPLVTMLKEKIYGEFFVPQNLYQLKFLSNY